MKVKLLADNEKIELLKAVGSNNRQESLAAQEILAAFVGPIIADVLQQAAISELVYTTHTYNFDQVPSIPLDLFDGVGENYMRVWSQSIAGGLPSNLVHGLTDFRFTTYRLDSAISFLKRYARDARLDVVAKAMERMSQELLLKMEHNAWAPVLMALAQSVDPVSGENHLIQSTSAGLFQLDDLNRLWTKVFRLHDSWSGGTPDSLLGRRGLTDVLISPEILEDIRAFAYNPMNTRGVPNSDESTAVALPDEARMRFFNQSGVPELFGVGIHTLHELGVGRAYNALFDSFYTPVGPQPVFNVATQDLVVGVDLSVDAFVRAVATEPTSDIDVDSPQNYSTVQTLVDDQFVARQEKIGWYTKLEEGRVVLDHKALVGVFV